MKSFKALAIMLTFSLVLMGCAAQAPTTDDADTMEGDALMEETNEAGDSMEAADDAMEADAMEK
jgi:ABC-type glycerol-3-phosphate transport system substrate-binding protein